MKVLAALLLTILLSGVVSSNESLPNDVSTTHAPSLPKRFHKFNFDGYSESVKLSERNNETKEKSKDETSVDERVTSKLNRDDLLLLKNPFLLNPKDILVQEFNTLNEETSNTKIQDEVAKTLKAESRRIVQLNATTSGPTTLDSTIKKSLQNEDAPYEDDVNENEENEKDDYVNDEDEEDDDEDEDDDGDDDEPEDEEQVMTDCPDYCKCAGEYAAATTATCTKLVDGQSFSTSIVHLRIENAGQIRLGPHAFQSMGLQQLESIVITDTRIVELNQTAFDGIGYLFSVNLTRNDLQEIHPNTFQTNKQLTFLAISGNPLKYTQDWKNAKHGLFDASSVTEFDFSFNGLTKLKHAMFSKMPSLTYVNLKGNKLKEIDGEAFSILESLVDVDLTNNLLSELPTALFADNILDTLRIVGNNFATLSSINAPRLKILDASRNKIKVIAKDDLHNVPSLDQLILSSNGLKRIHQHAFANLVELTHLDISDNKLNSLAEHHLRNNSRLQVLIINDNPDLKNLPIFKISGYEYNTFNIYRFECANCGLNSIDKDTFKSMPAITRLNLSKNYLTGLPEGLLAGLSSLRVLDLSNNIIGSLKSNTFFGATGLTKLSLAGNPLVTLQVTPFLATPVLTKLDVSGCILERVWNEARVPLTSLRSLTVRLNRLHRITVEELKATPNIVSLDLSSNPFDCDVEFKDAIQWLIDNGVKAVESSRYISNYDAANENEEDPEEISEWTDLGKSVCDGIEDGPPPRPVPHKGKKSKVFLDELDASEDSDPLLRSDIENDDELFKMQVDHGIKSSEEVEKAWTIQNLEYEDSLVSMESMKHYHSWYTNALWPVIIVIIITSMIILLSAHIAIYLAKRRGKGPVIRPPYILRQGFDNKNCGLVYKPLQEEIATPQVPKRGSFYSSSTFHYDKIVPESV